MSAAFMCTFMVEHLPFTQGQNKNHLCFHTSYDDTVLHHIVLILPLFLLSIRRSVVIAL